MDGLPQKRHGRVPRGAAGAFRQAERGIGERGVEDGTAVYVDEGLAQRGRARPPL